MHELQMPHNTSQARHDCAQVLAELVREGVTFQANVVNSPDGPIMQVSFTGGF